MVRLEDLEVYSRSMKLGEDIWCAVKAWASFEKNTIGYQLIRSVDSVSANISESYGRYHFMDLPKGKYTIEAIFSERSTRYSSGEAEVEVEDINSDDFK